MKALRVLRIFAGVLAAPVLFLLGAWLGFMAALLLICAWSAWPWSREWTQVLDGLRKALKPNSLKGDRPATHEQAASSGPDESRRVPAAVMRHAAAGASGRGGAGSASTAPARVA